MALTTYTNAPDIVADFEAWIAWKDARIAAFEANCPLARSVTYYFSQAGDDTTGDGSVGNPWQTRTKAASIVSAGSGDMRLRFNCGDMWRDNSNWAFSKDNVTIDSYGSGDKPFFNAFTLTWLNVNNPWTLSSGNMYTVSEANDVAYIRLMSDRLGVTRGTQLIRLSSSANVLATNNSFFYDPTGDVLYINLAGDNPNDYDIEGVISNNNNGVEIQGDGCRVEGLRADGYGIHRTSIATQDQPFTNRSTGNETNLYKNLEGYFSNTHTMAHNNPGSSGGRSMWLNCSSGLGQVDNANAMSVYNSYSLDGDHEFWVIDSEALGGALPEYTWNYSTDRIAGSATLAHSGGTPASLYVIFNVTLNRVGTSQCKLIGDMNNCPVPTRDDFTTFGSFVVKCTNSDYGEAHGDNNVDRAGGTIFYGNRYYSHPIAGGVAALRNLRMPTTEYFFNCEFICDMTDYGNSTFGFYNGSSGTSFGTLVNNSFIFKNWSTSSVNPRFGFNYDNRANTGAPDTGAGSFDDRFFNNIISINNSAPSTPMPLSLSNQNTFLKNNALFGITQYAGQDRGYDNMVGPVALASAYDTPGTDVAALHKAGDTTFMLSHDINGKRRNVARPDIGPVDFSSWGFDNGSGGAEVDGTATKFLITSKIGNGELNLDGSGFVTFQDNDSSTPATSTLKSPAFGRIFGTLN